MAARRQMKIDGIPVMDATQPLQVTVTKQDIAKSHRKDPLGCAAALAAIRQIPSCTMAKVHVARCYLLMVDAKGKKVWLRYDTPSALRTEIAAFDRGGYMQPDDYMLRPPRTRMGERQGSGASGARDRGSPNRKPSFQRHVLHDVRILGAKSA